MSDTPSPPFEPRSIILLRKLVLLALLAIVTAIGAWLLLRLVRVSSLTLSFILTDFLIGIVAGFSARWVLRKQAAFIRIVVTLLFIAAALELLGWFTGWQFGPPRFYAWRGNADWFRLIILVCSAGIAMLALFAWNRARRQADTVPAAPTDTSKRPHHRRKTPKEPKAPAAEAAVDPIIQAAKKNGPEATLKPRRKPQLHLSGEEEHRCPYCLELIVPDDPRGTVECKICHTLHHADCWAITGACQVPHYTT
jgi:hypothetical protein